MLSDGGQIEFHQDGALDPEVGWQFEISPIAIIDPYGQKTTLSYGNGFTQVTEPGGRWLRINYVAGTFPY